MVMMTKARSIIEIILVLVLCNLVPVFFSPLFILVFDDPVAMSNLYNIVAIITDIVVTATIVIYLIKNKRMSNQVPKLSDMGMKNLILIIICTYLIASVCELVTFILPMDGMMEFFIELMSLFFNGNPILVFCSVGIFGPVMEEFIFRGIIFRNLRFHWNFWISAIISSLIWAVIHLNLVQGMQAFVLGLLFAFVYEKCYKLWVPILLHIIVNVASVLAFYLSGEGSSMLGIPPESGFAFLIVGAVLGTIIAILITLYLSRQSYQNSDIINIENQENFDRLKDRQTNVQNDVSNSLSHQNESADPSMPRILHEEKPKDQTDSSQ